MYCGGWGDWKYGNGCQHQFNIAQQQSKLNFIIDHPSSDSSIHLPSTQPSISVHLIGNIMRSEWNRRELIKINWRWLAGNLFDNTAQQILHQADRNKNFISSDPCGEASRHSEEAWRQLLFSVSLQSAFSVGGHWRPGWTRRRNDRDNKRGKPTFSIMHTKFIADPISTWSSPEPKMNASGTTTWRFTKCDITPVDVDTWKYKRHCWC